MIVSIPTAIGAMQGAARGKNLPFFCSVSSGVFSFPTDPIGNFTLTLTNVVTGSSIQIESQDGSTTLHNSTAAGSTVNITLQAYAAGSPLNDLRIKVRKGSAAPYYQPYETLTTAVVGAQSIYVSQIPD